SVDGDDPFGGDGSADGIGDTGDDGTDGSVDDLEGDGTPAPPLPVDPTLITEEEIRSAPVGAQALLLPDLPETPEKMIRVARLLAEIGTPDFGHRLLLRVQKMDLTEDALADLGGTLPADTLLAIGTLEGLQPEGAQLALAIGNAYQKRLLNLTPDRIEALVETLIGDESRYSAEELATLPERRESAMASLRRMGDHTVPYLLGELGSQAVKHGTDPYTVRFRRLAHDLMTDLGESLIPVLTAALESGDETLQLTALEVLGQIRPTGLSTTLTSTLGQGGDLFIAGLGADSAKVREATLMAIRQTGSAFQDVETTAAGFAQTAMRYSAVESEDMTDRLHSPENTVGEPAPLSGFWRWESDGAGGGKIVCAQMTRTQQRLFWMLRYAQAAEQLAPSCPEYRELRDIAVLQNVVQSQLETMFAEGPPAVTADQPLPFEQVVMNAATLVGDDLGRRSTSELARTLIRAIRIRSVPAMGALTYLLANRADAAETLSETTDESGPAFVQALVCPDPRARFMAASALMKIAPERPWAQSHRLVETLTFFAGSTGSRRAVLVGFPDREREEIRRFCTGNGYECDFVGSGHELMRR
ncbi:MAG: hypothetical protein Q4C47_09350, partial [Planctomycetia bacterium]|nr:hypothetical protein [Planctomycetia bacterium]